LCLSVVGSVPGGCHEWFHVQLVRKSDLSCNFVSRSV
jgi:hypothetical protein